ncbi:helix-turn-helix domain-containing protein [Tomitella gaofuii]|uniref:helix-turn-helix domain-containing protein n=1 Tax=Tomitella gaofuii TaxID=2760083 RepID=UPI0015F99C2B|nr:helix-turn-helix transcriptional regulator [Tomitella gaofuii]
MVLRFRNLDVTPEDPVEQWGVEGLLTAIDRGSLRDWRRIDAAVDLEPYGALAEQLDTALELAEDVGVVSVLRRRLAAAQDRAARSLVTDRLNENTARFGGTAAAFARAVGTSPSRMSTYLRGTVMPSAAVLVKAELIAEAAARRREADGPPQAATDFRPPSA